MKILERGDTTETPPLAKKRRGLIGEISTSWARGAFTGFSRLRRTFWPTAPAYSGRTLSYTAARQFYRNDNSKSNLGAGFCKRMVNATVDFMELPYVASGDEITDAFLTEAIQFYWAAALKQMIRDSLRDAETVVRVRRYDLDNPLVSPDEWEACYLEVVPPETCAIYYKEGGDYGEIDVAYIRHEINVVTDQADQAGRVLRQPITRQHVLIEEITPDAYRYFDETTGEWRNDLEEPNSWGFVPLVEVCNEYDASLRGGTSELESPLPFVMAFHDVMSQALVAHKAHSIPKAKFKVNDMIQFIASNWPDAFETDETGQPDLTTFNGEISWKGTEILFMDSEEDVEFLEVTSGLSDSKVLLDFLLTCIVISSETPRSVLMDQPTTTSDEMIPFSKKINRKRDNYSDPIQCICKMVLAINHMEPLRVPLMWDEITPDIAYKKSQALTADVMSYEILASREVISDRTIRETLRPLIPRMRPPTQEAADAKKNVVPLQPATSTGSVTGTDSGNSQKVGNEN